MYNNIKNVIKIGEIIKEIVMIAVIKIHLEVIQRDNL